MKRRDAATAALLADLRTELVAPPSEARSAEHVSMMHLEEQVLAAPRSSRRSVPRSASAPSTLVRRTRAGVRYATATRPRRFAAVFVTISLLTGNVGLNAAGAVPNAVRKITDQITDTIVDTFGVPQAGDPRSGGPRAGSGSPTAPDGVSGPTGWGREWGPDGSRRSPSTTVPNWSPGSVSGPTSSPAGGEDPTTPPPTSGPPPDLTRPPSNNMQKDPLTPPGLPSDWNERVLTATRARLEACARSTELAPTDCPQAITVDPSPASVHWTLLNQPLVGATVIARPNGVAGQAAITVWGKFQMRATYTLGNETQPRYAYSGGVAVATMTWDGRSVVDVLFTSGSVSDRLPIGIPVATFERPAAVSDEASVAAMESGFASLIPAAQGMLASDPTQGAVVSFDSGEGDFTVTGAYVTVTGPEQPGTVHQFSASLVVDGGVVQLLSVDST